MRNWLLLPSPVDSVFLLSWYIYTYTCVCVCVCVYLTTWSLYSVAKNCNSATRITWSTLKSKRKWTWVTNRSHIFFFFFSFTFSLFILNFFLFFGKIIFSSSFSFLLTYSLFPCTLSFFRYLSDLKGFQLIDPPAFSTHQYYLWQYLELINKQKCQSICKQSYHSSL